ncbi:hypothetical protein Pla175_16660 [Pirellulimonas nuda]|uniref:HEAT repeat protein n=1 Tax=Pirellulimonas nuda TaxID=2528009 RepID=A0A518D9X9_9BACT|nr:HEAT repeat domain-containing protein [Pirellulimonas nuda]QDU88291.1 hypothetical protein Pla175_16660 [Pirellulimonas nuda]
MTLEMLTDRLMNGSPEERAAAAESLARMGESAAPAAETLALCASDADAGAWCVAALEKLGPPRDEALGPLTDRLSSADADCAYWCATLLGRAGERASASVSKLVETAQSRAPLAVRERACWALGRIGAASSRPALEQLSHSEQPRLARLAGEALAGF